MPVGQMQVEAMTAANRPPQKEQRLQQQPQPAVQQLQQKRETQQQLAAPIAGSAQRPAGESRRLVSLRHQFRQLDGVEHSCVILVRKIQYLGFSASTQLENHFKAFGPVQDVVLPQSHTKPSLPSESNNRVETVRQRPTNLAFVIMERTAGAEAALAAGTEQLIGGVTVVLDPFDGTRWKHHGAALGARKESPFPAREEDEENVEPFGGTRWQHCGAALDC
jgi:hypothetical protein